MLDFLPNQFPAYVVSILADIKNKRQSSFSMTD